MRPTAVETLEGADRLLRTVLAQDALPAATAASLASVRLMLKQARAGWGTRLPFLTDDTRELLALLAELAPHLPAPLAAEVKDRCAQRPSAPLLDLQVADEQNAALRELLARSVRALEPAAVAQREQVRTYLLRRVDLDPG